MSNHCLLTMLIYDKKCYLSTFFILLYLILLESFTHPFLKFVKRQIFLTNNNANLITLIAIKLYTTKDTLVGVFILSNIIKYII